ncbi:MAG: complex I NDUFA9 subunit family protein [Gammaproteobacteria bacterium]
MQQMTICILGGTGFVGRHLANRLTQDGYRVRILTRRRERHRELLVNPAIDLLEANIHEPSVLARHFQDVDAVINLVGILNDPDRRGAGFQRAHVELPRKVVDAARAAGVTRLLHMSALNADAGERQCRYLMSKGAGEDLVHAAAGPDLLVTSFRPSVIFGEGDSFFNRFATLLKLSPGMFPLACPDSSFAPVCIDDVTGAMCRALDQATGGERLELCGPEVFTLRALVEYTRDQLGLHCAIIGLGKRMSRLQAQLLGLLPGQPFTLDNFYALQKDSICVSNALPTLGINPTPVAAVVPGFLAGQSSRARYRELRRHAGRP